MTVGGWLSTRMPEPPDLLLERLRAALGDSARRDVAETSDVCLAAAEAIASRVLHGGTDAREQALDLLVADALITYAFEAASERPGEIVDRAARAMSRISGLADGPRPY